ncbi:MAG: kynureninase [Planctomycetes bacterium]|nr:kynureninase [Planctomycetota bacterium]
MTDVFQPGEDFARQLDAEDLLRHFRDRFHFPRRPNGSPYHYFCGHSLGLQPKAVRHLIEQELDDWARLGVEGHFEGTTPWYSYHEIFRDNGARLVGAQPGEVVMMNSLTVNLHLMLATFYRPTGKRRKILVDSPTFPSDLFAVQTHLRHRGADPANDLLVARPRSGEHLLRMEDVETLLNTHGHEIAVVLWNGVNFYTGQLFDLQLLSEIGHAHGCVVGLELAHGAGNVVLQLHDWQVDFAVWCNYKYLNSGPGAVAACFVHEKHGRNLDLPRLAGWWGTDPHTRFQMEDGDFKAQPGAEGWQVSNPPIFSLAPVRASLALFDAAGMPDLRAKSEKLTGYLHYLLEGQAAKAFEIISPARLEERGCQLSLLVHREPRKLFDALHGAGMLCDFRAPNVIRVAPVPLYNSFEDVWMFANTVKTLSMS